MAGKRKKGEGTVRLRKDGRWEGRVVVGYDEVGNPKVSNMVMLGAYVAGTKVLKPETIEKMVQEMFTGAKAKFVPLNIEAFRRGMACVQ